MKAISWYSISLVLLALGASHFNLLTIPLALIFACALITPMLVSLATLSSPPTQALNNIEKAIQTQSEALSLIVSKLPRQS